MPERTPERTNDLYSLPELDTPFGPGIENPDRLEWLRTDTHDDYRVDLWNTGESVRPMGRSKLAYRLCWLHNERASEIAEKANREVDLENDPVWEVIFAGEDFSPSPMFDIDGDLALGALVGFLAARPGDVGEDYFTDYTPRQLEFAEQHGEWLALWASELEERHDEREGGNT